jgi:hypothetical protein
MANANKFNQTIADIYNKVHAFNADTFKFMLSNVAPVAANAIKTDITEIAAGNGYTAGGVATTLTSSGQVSGLFKYICTIPVPAWTATGAFATFRYIVLYNSTPVNGNLIAWWDYGQSVVMVSTNTFTLTLDAVNGVVQAS